MTSDLVIVGAGGFARETAGVVHAINKVRRTWRLLGFLDDDPSLWGSTRGGLPVLGGTERVADLPDAHVVVCVVSPRNYTRRAGLVARLNVAQERFATLVHPSAQVGPGCVIGPGCVLLAQVALTSDATIGAHVLVMPQTVITHDDRIADLVTLSSGVRLGGGVVVEEGAYLGAGSLVREGLRIGAGSMVGMGSVVLDDVPRGQVWVGNPARYLGEVDRQTQPLAATPSS